MKQIPFTQLTDDQRARVAYLFADQYFGTDAGAFVYEVDDRGEVKGRSYIAKEDHAVGRSHRIAHAQVHMIEEVNITDELIRHARMSMDALAASIAQRIHQSQTQTTQVENS